jgi:hypothetical protein
MGNITDSAQRVTINLEKATEGVRLEPVVPSSARRRPRPRG